MNSLNLVQVDGGSVIKRGDHQSVFTYKLLDERMQPIDLDGKSAKITLSTVDGIFYQREVSVVADTVSFTIDKALKARRYTVEVSVDNYVFPSDTSTTIKVVSDSGSTYVDTSLESVPSIVELQHRLDNLTIAGYDDSDLRQKIAELSDRLDSLSPAPSEVLSADLERLKREIEKISQYDDSELKKSLTELSERIDNLQLTKGQKGDPGDKGADGKSAYDLAVDEGYRGTLQEWLASLRGRDGSDASVDLSAYVKKSELTTYDDSRINQELSALQMQVASLRNYDDSSILTKLSQLEQVAGAGQRDKRPPTSFSLDRSTNPWTIYFDNGCTLQLSKSMGANVYAYGYGLTPAVGFSTDYIPYNIIRIAQGVVSFDTWSSFTGSVYKYDNATVKNPLNDISLYDWSGWTNGANGNVSLGKVLFALGIITEQEVLSMGATRLD